MLRDRSLGTIVATGFASLLIMLAGLIALAIQEVDVAQDQRQQQAAALETAELADRLALSVARSDAALYEYLLSHQQPRLDQAVAMRAEAAAAAAELRQLRVSDPQSQQLAADLISAVAAWDQQARMVETMAPKVPPESAFTFHEQFLDSATAAVDGSADALRHSVHQQAEQRRRQLTTRGDRLTDSLIAGFGLAGLVGIFLGVYFVRLVTEPVARLVQLSNALRAGDYGRVRRQVAQARLRSPDQSGNEIEQLTGTFATMADTLEERERRLHAHAASLAAANRELTALQSLTDAALSELNLDPLLEQLLQRAAAGVGAQAGALFLENTNTGRMEARVLWHMEPVGPAGEMLAEATSFAEAVAAAGQPVVSDSGTIPWSHPFLTGRGVAGFCALPLRLGDRTIGLSYLEMSESRAVGETEMRLLRVFAERAERAVERARAFEHVSAWQRELERQVEQQKEQLLRSERLASIGLVGGSIAHELRNPLGVISNSVYFLTHRPIDLDEKSRRHLEIIAQEIAHATQIINNLVDFSSGIEPMATQVDLNSLIRMALEAVRVPPEIQVEVDLAEPLPHLLGDESQLLQVFEHLIRNAVQAMEDGGRLRICTAGCEGRLVAAVQDTGPGIPRAEQQRIFEPLVSTRTKGMGLGLTLVRRIVEAHGGEIRLDSESGKGAAFTVLLPLAERVLAAAGDDAAHV